MTINQVTDAESWKKLLAYHSDCLREENRLRYSIEAKDIKNRCRILSGVDDSFLSQKQLTLPLTKSAKKEIDALQRFALGDSNTTKKPNLSFGYPFFVGSSGQVIPLLFIQVAVTAINNGILLTRESVDLEINFAALWEVLPHDKELDFDHLLGQFSTLEATPGRSHFEQTLELLLAQLEATAGTPIPQVRADQFSQDNMPKSAVVWCPLLFQVMANFTYQLLRELDQLAHRHDWERVQPALRQLLTQAERTPYSPVPELAADPRLYVVSANDSQRQAVAAASERQLTVVSGPPGTGKSQLILNIVGDAVLKGQTILIASRNNEAVNVISERFLNQIDYPGTVRTGKLDFRRKIPDMMQQAFNKVRRGNLTSRLKELRIEYDQLLQKIETQRQFVLTIERLLHDQRLYQTEIKDLTGMLPDAVGQVQLRLEAGEGEKLSATIHTWIDQVRDMMERRQALINKTQALLVENRTELDLLKQVAAFERQSGFALEASLQTTPLANFAALEAYLQNWDSLLTAFQLYNELPQCRNRVETAQRQAEEARQGLLANLAAELGLNLEQFNLAQEQALRLELLSLLVEAQSLFDVYQELTQNLTALTGRSTVVEHLLELVTGQSANNLKTSEPDLMALHQTLSALDDILNAHQTYTAQVEIGQQLKALQREQAARLSEFDAILADLDKNLATVRGKTPALLLMQIEPVAERGDYKAWEGLIAGLAQLDQWCGRIDQGELTWLERLYQILSRQWSLRQLQHRHRQLSESWPELVVLIPVEVPVSGALFKTWAEYVHTWNDFSQACYWTTRRRYVQQQQTAYHEQSEAQIQAKSTQLQETKDKLAAILVNLPGPVASSMNTGAWPPATIDTPLIQVLEAVQYQTGELISKCMDLVKRLNQLRQGNTMSPQELEHSVQGLAVALAGDKAALSNTSLTPMTLANFMTAWVQFSQANQAEYELRQTQQALRQVEKELEQVLVTLPSPLRQNVDWTTILYADESAQPVKNILSLCRDELNQQVSDWQELLKCVEGVLQDNQLKSQALAKAIKQTKKDAGYLGGLIGRIYVQPELLLGDLNVWDLVVRIWGITTRLADLSKELEKYPKLTDAQVELDRLVTQRLSLAGRVLTERWRQTAAGLDAETIQGIDNYVNAIRALAADGCPDYYGYKSQAETNFSAALKLFPVWLTTNLSTQDLPLRPGLFDCVIIDEASQCDVPSALPLLFRAKRVVIIGDDEQLQHIASLPDPVHRQLLERHTIGVNYHYVQKSLFDLAAQSAAPVPAQILLNEHYRSHREIIEFSNQNFYDEALKMKTNLSNIPSVYQARGCGLFWLNVEGVAQRPGPGQVFNKQEEQAVVAVCRDLIQQLDGQGMQGANLGVVTPYRTQMQNIQRALKSFNQQANRTLVGTVHTFQGDERDVMIFSTVATGDLSDQSFKFMSDNHRLLNVAVTRAKLTLIIVGDHSFFMKQPKSSPYYKLAAYAEELGKVYPEVKQLPIFLPVDEADRPFSLGRGITLTQDTPYSNRLTLRQLLVSSHDFLWWYDPHMRVEVLDALALALRNLNGQVKEVRLLTRKDFWNNRPKEPGSITKKEIGPLKQELQGRGIKVQLAVTLPGWENPPHDRFLFAANQAVNMPPIGNIFQEAARLAEFIPSTVRAEEFEAWWQKSEVVFE